MNLHRIERLPDGFGDYDSTSFDEFEVQRIPPTVREAWYWYGAHCPYEGKGQLLMQTDDGLWHHHDCSHCCCYGPTAAITLGAGQPLGKLLESCTPELLMHLAPLTEAIASQHPLQS